jgi:hypothetical protein
MKLTNQQLKQIIKEEVQAAIDEGGGHTPSESLASYQWYWELYVQYDILAKILGNMGFYIRDFDRLARDIVGSEGLEKRQRQWGAGGAESKEVFRKGLAANKAYHEK